MDILLKLVAIVETEKEYEKSPYNLIKICWYMTCQSMLHVQKKSQSIDIMISFNIEKRALTD